MDFFVWSTIILSIWAAVGPLVGVRYGHVLTKRWQREHWINDNARQEYRELIAALFVSSNVTISNRTLGRETTQAEDEKEFEADSALFGMLNTRLFIRGFIEEAKIKERWEDAFEKYKKNDDLEALRSRLQDLIICIADEARKLGKD